MYYGGIETIDPNSEEIHYGNAELDPTTGEMVFPQNGEFQKVHSVIVDGGDRFGPSTIQFDNFEELIWSGNQGGHVTSYYGSNLEKYTSFQVHANQEIRQILPLDEFILILSQSQLRGQIRRGLPVFTHVSENLQDMQSLVQTSPSTILMGGHQTDLVEFDLNTSTELRTIPLSELGCAILRSSGRYICAGEATGTIHLLDPRTYGAEQSLEAHNGSLSDFDVNGNLLITCGFSTRYGNLTVDRYVKIYDLRVLRALAPIQLSIDPFLLRFMPSFSSRVCTVSPNGQMEILETQAVSQADISLYQVTSNSSMCLTFDVSSSCQQICFGDNSGAIHLFSSNPSAMFNSFSRETEFADPIETQPYISYTDDLSFFSAIPLPVSETPLLSDWPSYLTQHIYRKTPPIEPSILNSMKMVGNIGYCTNPGTFRRNQVQYKIDDSDNLVGLSGFSPNSIAFDRQFISRSPSGGGHNKYYGPGSPNKRGGGRQSNSNSPYHQSSSSKTFQIPKRYARMEWNKNITEETENQEHSFNRTKFPGLEPNQINSYCNSMLQVLYHIDFLRASLISHLCKRESCLSCELGFLFHMMDRSKSLPCLANNFLRAFRVVPEASALGLILQDSQMKQRGTLLRLIQSWNRFILHQIDTETMKSESYSLSNENGHPELNDPIAKLFSMKQENMNRCAKCNREEKKESIVLLSNLLYSADATSGGKRCKFVDILQRSLCPEQTTPAWCDQCQKYQPTFQTRVPKLLPPILSLNTCLDNAHDFQIWKQALEELLPEKIQQKMKTSPTTTSDSSRPPVEQNSFNLQAMKSCRYGRSCSRNDCKFYHEWKTPLPGESEKKTEFEVNPELFVKWLTPEIRVQIDSRSVRVWDLESIDRSPPLSPEKLSQDIAADYKLKAVVCFIKDPENEEKNNLVTFAQVDDCYFDRAGQARGESNWFLFNDFYVKEVQEVEAYSFNPKWKIPCVVFYSKTVLPSEILDAPVVKIPIKSDVFKEPKPKEYYGKNRSKITYKHLDTDEIPVKDTLVAIDAEFVTLGQEETELRSDGKLATIKPLQLSVARVTCIRGQGTNEGTPFIDDYISTQEHVVDYMTKFSGIKPGDLDLNFSSKNLTTLKSVYLKLRYLVDVGVKFVGHGLSNDFRVINLVVEPDQIIDTVNLFYLPNQRLISLKFLAWHFLGLTIQENVHDSIEDARTALQLYKKFEELKKGGKVEKELEKLYEVGIKTQWKTPSDN